MLGLSEVSQRWGEGWKERKEISTGMFRVQEPVWVQAGKCVLQESCVWKYEESLGLGWSSLHGSHALYVYLLHREKTHLVTLKYLPVALH